MVLSCPGKSLSVLNGIYYLYNYWSYSTFAILSLILSVFSCILSTLAIHMMLDILLSQSCPHIYLRLIHTIDMLNVCYQSSAKVCSVIPWLEEVHSSVEFASE